LSGVISPRPGRTRPWVADITYVPTHDGWLFLAAVMDLYSRKIVGWSMREDLETPRGRRRDLDGDRPSQAEARPRQSLGSRLAAQAQPVVATPVC
jgi:hypothetical protein